MDLESGGQFGDYQNEIYLGGLSGVLPAMPMAFAELEARAHVGTAVPSAMAA
jgi:lactate 2-monooxygenase